MSTVRVSSIQNLSGVEVYTAKAWVNFNGVGTISIRGSGNVASITDNGVGDYTVNFTNALADTNYSMVVTSKAQASGGVSGMVTEEHFDTARTSSAIRICSKQQGTFVDSTGMFVVIFR
jgi:hypothetical protein